MQKDAVDQQYQVGLNEAFKFLLADDSFDFIAQQLDDNASTVCPHLLDLLLLLKSPCLLVDVTCVFARCSFMQIDRWESRRSFLAPSPLARMRRFVKRTRRGACLLFSDLGRRWHAVMSVHWMFISISLQYPMTFKRFESFVNHLLVCWNIIQQLIPTIFYFLHAFGNEFLCWL